MRVLLSAFLFASAYGLTIDEVKATKTLVHKCVAGSCDLTGVFSADACASWILPEEAAGGGPTEGKTCGIDKLEAEIEETGVCESCVESDLAAPITITGDSAVWNAEVQGMCTETTWTFDGGLVTKEVAVMTMPPCAAALTVAPAASSLVSAGAAGVGAVAMMLIAARRVSGYSLVY